MSRDPTLRLADIAEACGKIEVYIAGYTFDEFRSDSKTQDAVIRQFEIIGEAVKALPDTLLEKAPEVP